jgi:hypothetical protein
MQLIFETPIFGKMDLRAKIKRELYQLLKIQHQNMISSA